MNKEDLQKLVGERLKAIREDRKIELKDAARAAGVATGTFTQYENGTRLIPVERIINFTRRLRVSSDLILHGAVDVPKVDSGISYVPKLSLVSAGRLSEIGSDDVLESAPTVPVADLGPGKWIAFEVDGDSMDRVSPPGSMILVNLDDKRLVPNACYVIADESGDATYKRYRPDPERFEPVSFNGKHIPLFPKGKITIFGRVRRSILPM